MKLLSEVEALQAQLASAGLFLVTGVTKSGTTWLQRMLDSHPEIACGGESKLTVLLNRLAPAFAAYNETLTKTNEKIYREAAVYRPLGQDQARAVMRYLLLDRLAAVRQAAADKAGRLKWIGDKDPDYKRELASWRAILPEARLVTTVRDGRDCYVSLWFHLYPDREPLAAENRADFLSRIEGHATTWRDTMTKFRGDAARHPQSHYAIRYENLLADAAGEMARLFAWFGCDDSQATVAEVVERNAFSVASGGRQPGEADPQSFLRKGIAGDWKNHFDDDCNRRYCAVAGNALADAGYGV